MVKLFTTLLLRTVSDPTVSLELKRKKEEWWNSQWFCTPSLVTSNVSINSRQAPKGYSSIPFIHTTLSLSKTQRVTDYLGHPSARCRRHSRYILSWKVQNLPKHWVSIKVSIVIRPLGDRHGCFGSALWDGGGWIPIRSLTFHGRLSGGVRLLGQDFYAPRLFPGESLESYEQNAKAGDRLKWKRVQLIILFKNCRNWLTQL